MKINFKHSASVEQFLSGEMLPAERENFEREVHTNPGLNSELRFSREINAALKRDDILDFRQKVLAARLENIKVQRETRVVHMNMKKFWYAAASFVLLAALGSTLYFSVPSGNTSEKLFEQYYSADNLVNVTRAGDANIVEAVIKFQEKDYQTASNLFNSIIQKDNGNIACWFYLGISNIETANYAVAEKAFNHIISDDQNLYVEHAEWYLGLCFLKSNQVNKAKAQFEQIAANPDNFHRQDAANLLKKLK
jgi:hypothetical protein